MESASFISLHSFSELNVSTTCLIRCRKMLEFRFKYDTFSACWKFLLVMV